MKGTFFIIAAAMLWGTTGTTQAFAPEGASPLTVGAMRLLVGGFGLLLVAFFTRSFVQGEKWDIKSAVLGILSVAAYQVTFFNAVLSAGVAVGTMVAISSAPVSAGILSKIILKEELSRKWFIATFLAIIGCGFLIFSGGTGAKAVSFSGILYALGAGLSYALYTLYGKILLSTKRENAVVAVLFFGGAVVLSPLLFFNDVSWVSTNKGIITMTHLGLFATTLSYIFFARGLKTVPVSKTATLSLAEPLTAAVLGILVLGESLNMMVGIGILILFSGIAILSSGE
jgi:DME family drug/metabolite transporter